MSRQQENGDSPQRTFYTGSGVAEEDITAHHTERRNQQVVIHRRTGHSVEPKPASITADQPYTSPSVTIQRLLNADVDEEHQSKSLFCELEVLTTNKQKELEWQEKARWVKFEEDVEDGGERWSKPRVASLNLNGLFELRRGLASGTVILDMVADKMEIVVSKLLDKLVSENQLEAKHKAVVRDLLLLPHRHMHEKRPEEQKAMVMAKTMAAMEKNKKTKLSFENLAFVESGRLPLSASARDLTGDEPDAPIDWKFNAQFRKKLPEGSHAAAILLGEVDVLSTPIVAMVRLAHAEVLSDLVEIELPTKFIFLLLANKGMLKRYQEIGRCVGTLVSDEIFREVIYRAGVKDDVLTGIDEFLEQSTVLPPCEWDPKIRIKPPMTVPSQTTRKALPSVTDGAHNGKEQEHEEEEESHFDPALVRTGRIFGGLISDIKRKLPWYGSDFKDALHLQVLATTIFMYFACLTPNIMFGALLGTATDNNMAAIECLVSGCVCGLTFHLFAGQPLTIIGATGPVLIIESIVFNFSKDNDLNYMAFRFWIGMWICVALLLIVIFDMSYFVKYITRFTEESFATLIALIFIYEAIRKLFSILDRDGVDLHPEVPKTCVCGPPPSVNVSLFGFNDTTTAAMTTFSGYDNSTGFNWSALTKQECRAMKGKLYGNGCAYTSDVFFFSCLLFIFTFAICIGLKAFRFSRFLPNKVRVLVSDFAVVIAIGLMVLLDFVVGLNTPKLEVPTDFRPTRDDRSFYVNPFAGKMWIIAAAIPPAILSTILIFMDQQITAVIVNRKEHLLKKGKGYHLDLLVIVCQVAICSFIGTPWFVASTVPSVNHVRSLSKESESTAPGEQPRYLGVREQRVSGTLVAVMLGLSALIARVLGFVPMAVLFGVSLFMGWTSLKGLQMVQRMLILFMPAKYQPDYMFLRNVPLRRVHLFTVIQLFFFAIMWVLEKIKITSLLFPLMVLALCGVRKLLEYIFTTHEIRWLDDIIPEDKKKEDDKKKNKKHAKKTVDDDETDGHGAKLTSEAVMNIPVGGGKTVSIPTNRLSYDPHTGQLNITDETIGAAIWQQIAGQQSHPPKYEEHFGKAVDGATDVTVSPATNNETSKKEFDDNDYVDIRL